MASLTCNLSHQGCAEDGWYWLHGGGVTNVKGSCIPAMHEEQRLASIRAMQTEYERQCTDYTGSRQPIGILKAMALLPRDKNPPLSPQNEATGALGSNRQWLPRVDAQDSN
eukprot:Gb_38834 [translate_table: standard]